MNREEKNIIYTAGDIQKYLSGQMTAAEMHAIEKAALDDPFLAEAIEGYSSVEDKDWNKELAELKKNFDKKENAPVVPITKTSFAKWWKAAAAVVLIGTSVTVAYLFSGNNSVNKQDIAQVAVADSAASIAVDSALAINEKKDSVSIATFANTNAASANGTISIPQTSTEQKLIAEVKPGKLTEDNAFVYTPTPQPASVTKNDAAKDMAVADEEIKQNAEEAPVKGLQSINNTNSPSNAVNEAALDKNAAAQNQARKEISNNNFNAQVVTEDNKPVAFAQVNVSKSKKAVYTDANGKFKVSAPDTTLDVVVTSSGYATKKLKLQNSNPQNTIVLQPNENQLTETVVVGKKREKKKEVKDTLSTGADDEDEEEDAEPEIGWSEYNNYLNNNLVIPGEAREKNIHGVVEVFVNLSKNGSIKEVKVGKPLCTGCDAEAIRLIKEGPKWDVKSNKPTKVKVKVTF